MDIKKALTNPWVLGGGAVIGLILMMGSRGGATPANGISGDAWLASQSQMNAAGMSLVASQTAQAYDLAKVRAEGSVQTQLGLFNMIQGMNQVTAAHDIRTREVNAGVTNARIQAFTAQQLGYTNAQLQMGLGKIGAKVSLAQIAANVKIAKINAGVSQNNMIASAIGSVVNTGVKAGFAAL